MLELMEVSVSIHVKLNDKASQLSLAGDDIVLSYTMKTSLMMTSSVNPP